MLAAGIGFLAALALIFVRVPIAIAIAIAVVGFIGYAMLNAMAPAFSVMGLTALSSTMSYNLAVVPLFILMGNLVAGAGISQELYRAAQVFVGHRRGGLGIATILSCGGFAAGIIPGLIGIVGYSVAVNWVARRHPERAPRAEKSSRPERIDAIKNVWAVCALFILVLGGIYGGFFTAIEASGIGACGALAFALLRRTSLKDLIEIFRTSAETTSVLFALIIGASVFSEFVNLTGAHQGVLAVVQNGSLSPVMVIMVICAIYVLLGCVLDSLAMMLLTLPMFFPIVVGLGFDPIWFGILVVMLVEIGLITPPIGMNLFVLKSILPDVKLITIIRGIVPFLAVDILRVILIALIPALTLFLPGLFFGPG